MARRLRVPGDTIGQLIRYENVPPSFECCGYGFDFGAP